MGYGQAMDILLVRHGESEGNLAGRMQGHAEYPLTERGVSQARALGTWLRERQIGWEVAYTSPLGRARQTAEILTEVTGGTAAVVEADLAEVRAGRLEGLDRAEIAEAFPDFMQRDLTGLGDFSAYGGESYDELQVRVGRVVELLVARHRDAQARVLVVAHGGMNFQLLKTLICVPVPRVCLFRIGNCSATLVRLRERRGEYLGEVVWHVPVELMGAPERDGGALFR